MTNSGFHAEITLKKDDLVFFSVPYDDGFTAYVNGKETEVIRVDEGLMAVLAPAGENTIDFVYQADGYSLASKGLAGSAGGIRPIRRVFCLEEKETLLNRGLSMRILP